MKSLAQFNEDRREAYAAAEKRGQPHLNGIACPDCGAELWDSNPTVTLTSNPPQKNIHCQSCKYRGYRLA